MAAPSAQTKRVLVVGPTGHGKSSIIGEFCTDQNNKPVVGKTLRSETAETKSYPCNVGGENVLVFDTPGLGDSEKRDQAFLTELVTTLQDNCSGVHKIYFVMQVFEPRYNAFLDVCLSLLLQLAPDIREKPSVLVVVLSKANQGNDCWNSADLDGRLIPELKRIIKEKHKIDLGIIPSGRGNNDRLIADIKNAPMNVFAQTQFMQQVQTLDTKMTKAREELEAAKQKEQQDQQEINRLQTAYDQANQAVAGVKTELSGQIDSLKKQLNEKQAEIHNHYYNDGGGSSCTLI